MSDAWHREHVAAARLWAADTAPYFASALFALSPTVDEGLGTVGVDRNWHLYVDPTAVARWTVPQFGSVLIHEAHHLLRSHAERAVAMGVGHADHERWNVAADFEINDDLSDLPLPDGGLDPRQFGFEPGEMAEVYYLQISIVPPQRDCGSGAHGVRGPHERSDDPAHVGSVSALDADLIRQEVARAVTAGVNAGGAVPDGLARWAKAFLHPKVDWRRELAAHVRAGTDTVAGAIDYSYRRPSRRSGSPVGRAVIFPALVQPVPRMAVVVDTSGSMDDGALQAALAEITGLLRATGVLTTLLTVLSCDTDVRNVQQVFRADQVRLIGGGGTDMRAAVSQACDLRPRPDVLVVLTDGYTPWPERKPACEVVVALVGDGPRPPPWARCVQVPSSERATRQ